MGFERSDASAAFAISVPHESAATMKGMVTHLQCQDILSAIVPDLEDASQRAMDGRHRLLLRFLHLEGNQNGYLRNDTICLP